MILLNRLLLGEMEGRPFLPSKLHTLILSSFLNILYIHWVAKLVVESPWLASWETSWSSRLSLNLVLSTGFSGDGGRGGGTAGGGPPSSSLSSASSSSMAVELAAGGGSWRSGSRMDDVEGVGARLGVDDDGPGSLARTCWSMALCLSSAALISSLISDMACSIPSSLSLISGQQSQQPPPWPHWRGCHCSTQLWWLSVGEAGGSGFWRALSSSSLRPGGVAVPTMKAVSFSAAGAGALWDLGPFFLETENTEQGNSD